MENLIFEEVDGDKIKFGNLLSRIKKAILEQNCCRDGCGKVLDWHDGQPDIHMNFIECSDGQIRWWCSKSDITVQDKIRHLEWLNRRAENLKQLIKETKKANLKK